MASTILLGYATRYGSTREVAAAIAAALRESGIEVDLQPLSAVRTLERYGAVVLGAPLYMFRWHKDAKRFLSRHREALTGLPAAVFALGPFEDVPKQWEDVRANLDKELAGFPWFAPVAVEIFGGVFDPAKLTFPYNLVPGLKKMPVSDIRDWDAIRAWANGLVPKLRTAP
jgi:menaquinone-dependent protoporphyrinogen oxidase